MRVSSLQAQDVTTLFKCEVGIFPSVFPNMVNIPLLVWSGPKSAVHSTGKGSLKSVANIKQARSLISIEKRGGPRLLSWPIPKATVSGFTIFVLNVPTAFCPKNAHKRNSITGL